MMPRIIRALVGVSIAILCLSACSPEEAALVVTNYHPEHVVPANHPIPAGKMDTIKACESHGNYGAISGTGAYRGAYQFSQRTWDNVAGTVLPSYVGHDPATAPPLIQDAMARALYRMTGPGSWPHCGFV